MGWFKRLLGIEPPTIGGRYVGRHHNPFIMRDRMRASEVEVQAVLDGYVSYFHCNANHVLDRKLILMSCAIVTFNEHFTSADKAKRFLDSQ